MKKKANKKRLASRQEKLRKQNGTIECWFCGSKKNLQQHHIIPIEIGGKGLRKNKTWICEECHPKLHQLLTPVIEYLVAYISNLQKALQKNGEQVKHRIGFIWNNGKKPEKGKKGTEKS